MDADPQTLYISLIQSKCPDILLGQCAKTSKYQYPISCSSAAVAKYQDPKQSKEESGLAYSSRG